MLYHLNPKNRLIFNCVFGEDRCLSKNLLNIFMSSDKRSVERKTEGSFDLLNVGLSIKGISKPAKLAVAIIDV